MFKHILNRFTCSEKQLPIIINRLRNNRIYPILDHINENGNDHFQNYKINKQNIIKYPNNHMALKLSSLNIENDYNLSKQYANDICETALENNCKILVDAENYLLQDKINELSNELILKFNKDNTNIYKTYQCYRKDSFSELKNDMKSMQKNNLGIKLVRGAYYNQDHKYNILFDNIEETHEQYNNMALYLFENVKPNDKILIATHNSNSIDKCLSNKHLLQNDNMLEFAQLMGMSDNLSKQIAIENKMFKYVPYGKLYESLPYLMRRFYENIEMIQYFYK